MHRADRADTWVPPVVVAPREQLGHVLLGLEALHELDDLEVGNFGQLRVGSQVEVLLGIQHTLCRPTHV